MITHDHSSQNANAMVRKRLAYALLNYFIPVRSERSAIMSDKPLFQGMDEKEREIAPQQVPQEAIPAQEVDRDGTAGATIAAQPGSTDTDPDRESVVGSEDQYEPPVVPAQPTIGAVGTTTVPPTAAPDELTRREQDATDRARE
jgi:hypothetical protein